MSKELVWFITGTSYAFHCSTVALLPIVADSSFFPIFFHTQLRSGFGKELSLALLERGDKVISTARSLNKLAELKQKGAAILELDVTAQLKDLRAIAERAIAIYGRIDVVVNNAGYLICSALEENTSAAHTTRGPLRIF